MILLMYSEAGTIVLYSLRHLKLYCRGPPVTGQSSSSPFLEKERERKQAKTTLSSSTIARMLAHPANTTRITVTWVSRRLFITNKHPWMLIFWTMTLMSVISNRFCPHPGASNRQQESGTDFFESPMNVCFQSVYPYNIW